MEISLELTLLLGFLAVGGLLLFAGIYIKRILPASGEIKYIKTELNNALTPEAKAYWKKELRLVYKRCIFGESGHRK